MQQAVEIRRYRAKLIFSSIHDRGRLYRKIS